jgi:hypothetical protein
VRILQLGQQGLKLGIAGRGEQDLNALRGKTALSADNRAAQKTKER